VSIPIEIWNLSELHPNERVLLAEVASFDDNGLACFAGNDHFADLLNVAQSTARDYIYRLIELGYVDREGTRYDRRLSQSTKTKSLFDYNEVVKRRKRSSHSTKTKSSNPAHTNTYTNTPTKSITKSAQVRGVVLPYETEKFRKAWTEWLEYKRTDHRFKYKTAQTEQRALMTLANEHPTESTAIEAIHTAIANGWKGLVFGPSKGRRTRTSGKAALEGSELGDQLRELAETGNISGDNRNRL
jgi:hypothetical protein